MNQFQRFVLTFDTNGSMSAHICTYKNIYNMYVQTGLEGIGSDISVFLFNN